MKKEKEIHARFAMALQAVKIMATVHEKCLVKIKAFNLGKNTGYTEISFRYPLG